MEEAYSGVGYDQEMSEEYTDMVKETERL